MPATQTQKRTIKHVRQELANARAERDALRTEALAPIGAARDAKRALTDAETATVDAAKKRLAANEDLVALLSDELDGFVSAADDERKASGVVVRESWESDPKRGYASANAFLADVMNSTIAGRPSPRLATLSLSNLMATAGSDEQTTLNDPYGGFLIPRELIASGIRATPVDVNPFKGRTGRVSMGAARILNINARVDKDHSTSVSGGLRVYRRAETQTVTSSRMQFEQVTLQKNELMGVTYAAEELLRASPEAFVSILSMGFGDEFDAKVFEEILNGTGVGCYQGIANSPALVTVSKETGQAADTITYTNLVTMMSRCWGYSNAVWYANHGCLPALAAITLPGGMSPVYQSANGIATILGRPAFFGERAAALGDLGDIILVNPSEYLEDDGAPIESASSIHVRFLEHEQTFKFWTENAGAPWWRIALTPKRGPTLSPFVYLQAR